MFGTLFPRELQDVIPSMEVRVAAETHLPTILAALL